MKGITSATLVLAAAHAAAGLAAESEPAATRRFALVVGANRGAVGRVPLRYAVTDAERFAEVVTRMGGVRPADRSVLHDPTRRDLLEALARTGEQAGGARDSHARVEVLFYFSGHADDQGLMLGRETLSYRELRAAVGSMPADVGITILDACASGAITRLKGGRAHPAFLAGTGSDVKGYAFLTSSSENEAAQESERLRGSFFTHALVSGLRGAADVTGDGRVTLHEAYQFAFHETLAQTTTTAGGAQHPSYDIKMAGAGEVVMTDLRQTSSHLVLGEELDGRFFLFSAQRRLVAELHKPLGRRVELGLDPGEYEVIVIQREERLASRVVLAEGRSRELLRGELREAPRWATRSRGGDAPSAHGGDRLDGRLRAQAGAARYASRFTFLYWARPTVAYELGFGTGAFAPETDLILGARYYPPLGSRLRPYVGAALGRIEVGEATSLGGAYDHGVLGGEVKAGLDVLLGRSLSLHLGARGTFAPDRWEVSPEVGLGWSFGGRRRE